MASTLLEEEIPGELKSRSQETMDSLVVDVRAVRTTDEDGSIMVVFTFVLGDPPDGEETWPIAQLWALRGIAREVVPNMMKEVAQQLADEMKITVDAMPRMSWSIEFEPAHMAPLSSDDESIEL